MEPAPDAGKTEQTNSEQNSDIALSGPPAEAAKLVAAMTDQDQIEILHWLRVEANRRRHAKIVAEHAKQ